MTVSLVIWVLTGALIGVGYGMAMKHTRLQYVGNAIIAIVCAVAGAWVLTKFGVEIGGPYIGAMVNAAIGGVAVAIILPIALFVMSMLSSIFP